jgi:putative membrane protein
MNNNKLWQEPQRQSGAALIIILYKAVWQMLRTIWPILLLWVWRKSATADTDRYQWMALGISVLVLVPAVLRFIFFRFYIQNGQLIIKQGAINKKTITLPLDKIQAVHIEQSFLLRVFNAAKISFDTPGSEKMEARIDAISMEKAAALRAFILDQSAPATVTGEAQETTVPIPERVVLQPGLKDLLKLSITNNHFEALGLLFGFALSLYDNVRDIVSYQLTQWFEELPDEMAQSSAVFVISLLLLLAIVAVFISTVRIFLQYFNYKVTEVGKGWKIGGGLISTQQRLVPFTKIQFLSWRANWLRKKINFFILHLNAAGAEDVKKKMQVSIPITSAGILPVIARPYYQMPDMQLTSYGIQKAFVYRRILMVAIPVTMAVCVLLYFVLTKFFWLGLLLLPYFIFNYWLVYKKFKFKLTAEALQINKGKFGIHTILLKWIKVQQVQVQQSLYQQQHQLATLYFITAAGNVVLPYITLQEALAIENYVLYKVESSNEGWL